MDVYRLSGLDALDGVKQRREKWSIRFDVVAANVCDDRTQAEMHQVLLRFDASVNRNENIEGPFCELQKQSVLAATPAGFCHGLYRVAGNAALTPA